jgi:hypothetical protein
MLKDFIQLNLEKFALRAGGCGRNLLQVLGVRCVPVILINRWVDFQRSPNGSVTTSFSSALPVMIGPTGSLSAPHSGQVTLDR